MPCLKNGQDSINEEFNLLVKKFAELSHTLAGFYPVSFVIKWKFPV